MRFWIAALAAMLVSNAAGASPNIVVVLTDDQDTTSIAYMPKVLSLIAEQGVTFTNSFVNYSLCAPSRVSFLTGQAAHNHGVRSNAPGGKAAWEAFKEQEGNTLPVWLEQAGYRTALLGKYINGYGKKEKRLRRGEGVSESSTSALNRWTAALFNRWNDGEGGVERDWVPVGWDLWYAFAGGVRYYDYAINENGALVNFGGRPEDYSTDVLKERAIRFIKDQSQAKAPFFLLISTKAVHGKEQEGKAEHAPVPSPKYENALKDVALPSGLAFEKPGAPSETERTGKDALAQQYVATLEALQSVDDLVEGVVGALQSAGILDDTILVYTSDNGFLYGDHGRKGKRVLFEGGIRVPLIIRGPGIPKNAVRDQLVNNLDVVATIVDLAGASPGLVLDGRSLRPLFADPEAAWRSAILIEKGTEFGVRTAKEKYLRDDDGSEELYDLAADPHELANKAADANLASRVTALRATLDTLQTCAGATCWVP